MEFGAWLLFGLLFAAVAAVVFAFAKVGWLAAILGGFLAPLLYGLHLSENLARRRSRKSTSYTIAHLLVLLALVGAAFGAYNYALFHSLISPG